MRQKYTNELLHVLAHIRDYRQMGIFLEDLLTPAELADIVTRWQLVKQLHAGIPQRTIAKNLHVSIAKITRGSRMLLNPNGGFNKMLNPPSRKASARQSKIK